MTERFFAPCPRGLEHILADELKRVDALDTAPAEGGVAFAGELALAMHANLESRIASRILWRVGGGSYRNADDLYGLVHAIDWSRHFLPTRTLRVDVAATRSPLTSIEFAMLRTKDAVCDRMRATRGIRPSIDKRAPDVRVHVHQRIEAVVAHVHAELERAGLLQRDLRVPEAARTFIERARGRITKVALHHR